MKLPLKLLNLVGVALLLALVSVPLMQIVLRGAVGMPFIGAEELTRFLMICLVFLGYPLVVEAGENIVMGELRAALPAPARRVLNLAISLLAIGGCGLMAWITWNAIFANLMNKTPTLGIPFWLFLGATLVAFAGATIIHLVHLRKPPQSDTNVSV